MTDKQKDKAVETARATVFDQPATTAKKKAKRKFSARGWTAADDMLMLRRVQRFVEGVPDAGLAWLETCVNRSISERFAARREGLIGQAEKAVAKATLAEGPTPALTSVGGLV